MLFWLMGGPAVQAQTVVDWVAPEQQRITVLDNADEHRQVRFTAGWETADYLVFNWHDLRGEIVYLRANDDRVAIDFPLTVARISSCLHRYCWKSRSARVATVHSCLGTLSASGLLLPVTPRAASRSRRRCAPVGERSRPAAADALWLRLRRREQPRAEIEDFLRDIHFVDRGYVEKDAAPAAATTEVAVARQFALGQNATGTTPQGLNEVPLGYAVSGSHRRRLGWIFNADQGSRTHRSCR